MKRVHTKGLSPLYQYDLWGNFIQEWSKETDAALFYSGYRSSIGSTNIKHRMHFHKFFWMHKKEGEPRPTQEEVLEYYKTAIKLNRDYEYGTLEYDRIHRLLKKLKITYLEFFNNKEKYDLPKPIPKYLKRQTAGHYLYTSEWNRIHNLKKKYGLTVEDYEKMFEEQHGLCAICGLPEAKINENKEKPTQLSVDHDHKTGKVRGLLCTLCNKGIGILQDDPKILKNALDYLKFAKL